MDEIEHAQDLVRRKAAQHRQADVTMPLEFAEDQCDDEHFLVVAHVAVVGVPGAQANVEARVLRHHVLVDRPDLRQLAVWSRQQRVQEFQAQVLLAICVCRSHGVNSIGKICFTQVREASSLGRSYRSEDRQWACNRLYERTGLQSLARSPEFATLGPS